MLFRAITVKLGHFVRQTVVGAEFNLRNIEILKKSNSKNNSHLGIVPAKKFDNCWLVPANTVELRLTW
jgi:hypothetical protein